ncbi:MAG: hypothetical protein C0519_03290 [Hyphomicrobium sp.]|nr:hypothetical protein [Hyphomicrobium sp.]PPD09023.1 MAG: hypothetical protein CTY28_02920 [Hyphomicrobium sp.]
MKTIFARMGLVTTVAAAIAAGVLYWPREIGHHDQLMQRLDADLGIQNEDYATLRARGQYEDMLMGKIEQHATQTYNQSEQVERILGFMKSKNVVLPDGQLASVAYYDAMKYFFPGDMPLVTGHYEKWQHAHPQSPAPIIVKASNTLAVEAQLLRPALQMRGDFIERSKADPEKLKAVQEYLLANKKIGSLDPYWYNLMVEVSIFLGASQDVVKALVQEGLERHPKNIQLPVLASNRFASQWGGAPNDIYRYAQWAQTLPSMKDRPDLYPRIYANAMQTQYGLKLFQLVDVDWDTMRAGIRALARNFSGARNPNIGAALACLRGDRSMTHEIMIPANFTPAFSVWPDPDAFGVCQRWALQIGLYDVQASAEADASPAPQDAVNP